MKKGVLVFCFNTEFYRYDKIAAKTIPLIKKNLGLPVTVITNYDTFKLLPPLGWVDYRLIENQTGNMINGKPWHNLDRHRAYELSPYDKTLLVDIDYFCYTGNLQTLFDSDHEIMLHDKVYDLTGKRSYDFRNNSAIPMVWATLVYFKKCEYSRAVFEMVRYVKEHYSYFCNLYRIDFGNFRNDYAFAIALQQLNGLTSFPVIPTKLATLPASAKVKLADEQRLIWEMDDKFGVVDTDVHVIDKGVAYV